MSDAEQKEYVRLIAAQKEAERRFEIKSISNTLKEEHVKKRATAIATGICFAGLMAATHFFGKEPTIALQNEIEALKSFPAFASLILRILQQFTPIEWGMILGTCSGINEYIKHKRNYDKANQEFYDMIDNEPVDYLNIVDHQAGISRGGIK